MSSRRVRWSGPQPSRAALDALVAPTRAEEGCLSYDRYESRAKPGVFITVELWRSQQDPDAHTKSPHLQQAMASAGSALVSADIRPLALVG